MQLSEPLDERYRPRTLDDLVGQPEAVAVLREVWAQDQFAKRKFWIAGDSGMGKSTIARIIGRMVTGDESAEEWNAADVTVDFLRDVASTQRQYAFTKTGRRCTICNEADRLSRHAIGYLKDFLDHIPKHHTWAFTTTHQGQKALFEGASAVDEDQLLSRCIQIDLVSAKRHALEVAIYLRTVARTEGLDGASLDSYVALVNECGNIRRCLQVIAKGKLREGVAA